MTIDNSKLSVPTNYKRDGDTGWSITEGVQKDVVPTHHLPEGVHPAKPIPAGKERSPERVSATLPAPNESASSPNNQIAARD